MRKLFQLLKWANLKKTMAVIVVAALILAAFAILPLPYVKAQASQAEVLTYSHYINNSTSGVLAQNQGDLVVVGEIQNVGSDIIQNATVGGTAYSSSGQTLASAEGQAYVYEMTPGQKAPFSIDFTPSSSTTSNSNWIPSVANITVTVLSVTDTSTSPYTGLTVPQGPDSLNNSGVYTIVGTIVNSGKQTMAYVWVVTTFYNAAGTVVALNFTDFLVTPSAVLAPGDATRWVATPADNTAQLTNEIKSYSYVIDSVPSTTSATTQPSLSPTASPTPSPFPVLPIVVVVVVVAVAAAALMLLRKRQKLPPPPPPPPPPPMPQELSVF
jgi:hypothetical protein